MSEPANLDALAKFRVPCPDNGVTHDCAHEFYHMLPAEVLQSLFTARHHIWYPLFDTPVTVTMSREQMQSLADELRGVNVHPGWAEYFAGELDKALKASLDD